MGHTGHTGHRQSDSFASLCIDSDIGSEVSTSAAFLRLTVFEVVENGVPVLLLDTRTERQTFRGKLVVWRPSLVGQ